MQHLRSSIHWLILLSAFWLTVLAAVPASATLFVRLADDDLARQSPLIAEVVVRDVTSAATSRPRTDAQLDVIHWIAGEPAEKSGEPVIVRMPGGITADSQEFRLFGLPKLDAGDHLLVFLAPTATPGVYHLKHLMQGLFFVEEIDGEMLAFRPFLDATEVTLPEQKALDAETPRQLERFTAWLRDVKAGISRPADYRVAAPAGLDGWITDRIEKFTLFESGGFNLRWPGFETGASVPWRSHSDGQQGLASGGHSEFQSALQAWNNDPSTPIDLRYAGQTGATGGFSDFDGVNTILFNDISNDIGDGFTCTSGGTLAIGGPWFASGTHFFDGRTFVTILGGDIVTNKGIACWIPFNRRGEEVFAHELGHTLGLGHSCGDSSSGGCNTFAKDDALMRATAHGDNRGARLGSDDRSAIAFLYGRQLEPPSAPNGLLGTAVRVDLVELAWNDTASNETSFALERSRNGGAFQQIASLSANTRNYSDRTAPSGSTIAYRVRAANGAGNSGYSNQISLTTLGAPPPSGVTVEILSATEARLSWVDNASGEAGFEILADGFGAFLPVGSASQDATEAMISGLWPNTNYTFRLRSTGGPAVQSSYVDVAAITQPGTPEPCVANASTLCLNQGRFKVQVAWRDFSEKTGSGTKVEIPTADSGLFWFFDVNNWEMLVKVLDGCGFNDHYWVFAAATTNVEFTLVVSDTATGFVSVHTNDLGVSAPAITDTEAMPVCPGSDQEPSVIAKSTSDPSIQMRTVAPQLSSLLKADCSEDNGTLCLNSQRFQVRATWRDFENNTGDAKVVDVPVLADDSGLLWFFSPDNWEVLLKVLDGCDFNDHYWVFSAATTNVEYRIEVTDTLRNQTRVYTNQLGTTASAVTDTEAFATCP